MCQAVKQTANTKYKKMALTKKIGPFAKWSAEKGGEKVRKLALRNPALNTHIANSSKHPTSKTERGRWFKFKSLLQEKKPSVSSSSGSTAVHSWVPLLLAPVKAASAELTLIQHQQEQQHANDQKKKKKGEKAEKAAFWYAVSYLHCRPLPVHSGGNCANAVVWQWHWHCAHYSQLDKFLKQILAAAAAAESVEYGGGGEWQNGENVLSAESERKGEREGLQWQLATNWLLLDEQSRCWQWWPCCCRRWRLLEWNCSSFSLLPWFYCTITIASRVQFSSHRHRRNVTWALSKNRKQ